MFNLSSNFIKKIKKFFFPFYKNSELKFVFKKLQQGFQNESKVAMFVGGCVRKYLSNEKIDDIDIATSLTTEQIKEKFKDTRFKVIDSGVKHGTVTLVSDKLKLELTTLRKDVKTDGRHAEIEYTDDWQEDSERRDFTINAIYLDINGKIFDPQLGVTDLKNCNIKFIGDPQKRIEEDYLRIIRFIRFSLEYVSKIEPTTINEFRKKYKLYFLLVYPNIRCSTKHIYSKVKKHSLKSKYKFSKINDKSKFIDFLINKNNDLQLIVENKYPIIKKLIVEIEKKKGCYFSRMTGSGSVCYGVFKSEKTAKAALNRIKLKYPRYWLSVAKTI